MLSIRTNSNGTVLKCQYDAPVNYKGQNYMTRMARLSDASSVLISELALEMMLCDDSAAFTQTNTASRLDQKFYGYVNAEVFTLDDSEFSRYIQESLA